MSAPIQQSEEFTAPTEALFELYMDSRKHSKVTGSAAKLSRKPGWAFTAFNGALRGRNLPIVPKKMIVQPGRAYLAAGKKYARVGDGR